MCKGGYASPVDLPIGKFIGYEIWKRDPSPPWRKLLCVAVTAGLVFYSLFSPYLVIRWTGIDDGWDRAHGYDNDSFFDLVAITLGISVATAQTICSLSYGVYALLMVADILLGGGDNDNSKKDKTKITSIRTHPWPVSWKTDNTVCYHEMFSEPTRWGRILRRPGNTLSNANYLLSSICVLVSTFTGKPSVFWTADALFGVMLLILTVSSNIWHASNAPWSQYPDIWSMDCCILYLLVRYCSLCGYKALVTYGGMELALAEQSAGTACLLVFLGILFGLGKLHTTLYRNRYLHGCCLFSGRARLLGKGDVWGQGQIDCHVSTICAFAALPVVYTGIPIAIQVLLIDSFGSVAAANWVVRTLAVGWTYRLWDRWCFDGCLFMRWFSPLEGKQSLTSTVGSAIFSPTAVLHIFTGFTLLAGYMHCRSVEDSVFGV
eukprot:CAMPEP_0183743586 /NCGR_PEP_ID=MMETSP0737-20130205/65293_1 /TAXON_ID=385413 /ORGANISM="Thalassiosira miniscula, Strain CCMP1093" /LENGTH=432 /DNA_ID=CAMNT_0025979209 /DNA_START=714 /DNA_END=2012 /DNA_ORIENTATION=-